MKFMGQCSVQFIIPSNLKIIVIMNNVLQHLKLKMKITTTKKETFKNENHISMILNNFFE